ncbi:MAG: hypothetical protein NTY53_23485, partial [Kiritimatiellaeota bacterium]|nr:hypothetical protein [Kiritimatiellota bacterium]
MLAICDANNPPSGPGAGAGSLGYAQNTVGISGMTGGMLGIAFDEWGNFSTTWGGHAGGSASLNPFTVSIRGPGNGSTTLVTAPSGALNFPNYNLLYTSATLSTNVLVPQPSAVTRPTGNSDLRQALVNFDMSGIAAGHAYVTVQIYDGSGNLLGTPVNNQDVGTALISYFGAGSVPTSFLVVLTSGTGAARNTHEVRDLTVNVAVPNPNNALLSQTFTHIAASGWNIGGNAFLTAPSLDTDGSGWLRLTPNLQNQVGYALGTTAIAASNGIQVAFDFNDWGGGANPGDGILLAIIDANHPPSGPGGHGGGIGYAQEDAEAGIVGGMLGIALDEAGYFSTASQNRSGGTATPNPYTCVIRGP